MITPNGSVTDLALKIATPGLFAKYVSRETANPWRMARHMVVLDRALTDIATGRNKRLIVQLPPRHGKSMLTSCYFPAYYLGLHPGHNIIMAGATDDLALDFSGRARDVISEHGWMFGVKIRADKAATHRWELEQGGGLRAGGVGSGAFMGRGANLLTIDDYFRNVEAALSEVQRTKLYQWYLTTSESRLTPDGAIVLMATRWHPKDLIGMVLDTAEKTGEKWKVISFPALGDDGAALWPEQWPAEKMAAKRDELYASGYPWMWEALYQQNPPEILDSEWPPEYFDGIWCEASPADRSICAVALDPSLGKTDKADYSAFVAVTKGYDCCYYVEADISRRPSHQMVNEGVAWMRRLRPDAFGCETNQFQDLLRPMFESRIEQAGLTMHGVWGIHNRVDKMVRIRSLTQLLATGRLKFIKSPGTRLLVEQLRGFPSHKYDDGPDALEMAIRLAEELLTGSGLLPRPEVYV